MFSPYEAQLRYVIELYTEAEYEYNYHVNYKG